MVMSIITTSKNLKNIFPVDDFAMNRFAILPLILLLILASCSNSNDATSSVDGWTIPGVGTQFLFVNTFTGGGIPNDSLGLVVEETDQSNAGVSGVVVMYGSYSSGSSGILDYSIQHNGDFWLADEINNNNLEVTGWDPFPTGSHDTPVGPVVDTSFVAGYRELRTDTNYYIDSEKISTPVGSFSTIRVESRICEKLIYSGQTEIIYDTLDYWFAPSVGYYVKATVRGVDNYATDLIKYYPN
jgi:hypothetical protein